jgi:HAMP domain-containing protein/two-component sensor histidine kinase
METSADLSTPGPQSERSYLQKLLSSLQLIRSGDFSVRMPNDSVGIEGKIADTFNEIVAANQQMAQQLELVGQVVGREGKTRKRVFLGLPQGAWREMEESINALIDDLLWPTAQVTGAIAAVAKGDLLKKVPLEVDGRPLMGEFLSSASIVNTMIRQLEIFTSEVTRVAREVGTEGKLGGQAEVPEVTGVWKDLTLNVNSMANNLTAQVRNIANVTIAVANGDLSKKITVDVRGEILQLKEAINTMVDQLRSFASEVTRVAREVGTDGKLGGQAIVPGVAGTWKDLTDSVNAMCGNLTAQVRNIAQVTTAVAGGDLSRKITANVRGEILELKDTINTMVDQLNAFASEVTRVAREVGTEGKLGGQAAVPGVAGTWKDLTDSVNFMASNLTAQVRNIADVATAIASGDLSKKITVSVSGEILQLKETINTMVDQLNAFAGEVTRVAREVGTEGILGGQANVPGAAGTWEDLTDSVNSMAGNLTAQVRNIAEVTTAVARGDLSRKITVDVKGEILELKNTINTMVDRLNAFASEVTRVAREVGTEGKLGGQAKVSGVAGTWKDLTDTVNVMAANLTEQVRGIVKVVTAVANGDLKQNLTVKSKGEVAALAETINNMTDTLAIFADQVTSVAREVGVEGRLGGQANVPGAAGTWKDLTGNVNLLAANLTNQVRAIAEVATAVTKGDLTRSIQVAARGEVAELKDNINTMIDNLRLTTEQNTEQDWLKTNLANFTNMLQGQRDLATVGRMLLSELAPLVGAQVGVIYQFEENDGEEGLRLLASYADGGANGHLPRLRIGEGLAGQCVADKRTLLVKDLPPDTTLIGSALVKVAPQNIIVLPVLFENRAKAVIELASVKSFTNLEVMFLEQLTNSIGIVLNSIAATMQTEELNRELENRVAERTSELEFLAREVDHRAKNILSVVQSICRLSKAEDPAAYISAVEGRIRSLSIAHTLLSESRWEGADLRKLVGQVLAPYRPGATSTKGPDILLEPRTAQTIGLTLHELATNAAKYGALAASSGMVTLHWDIEDGALNMTWEETGGPSIRTPITSGYGMQVIGGSAEQLGGEASFEWQPSGLRCSLVMPLGANTKSLQKSFHEERIGEIARPTSLAMVGNRVLVVEDEPLVAMNLSKSLAELGFSVVGPYSTLAKAAAAAVEMEVDGALLGVNLSGENVYPVADILASKNVPFAFITGYGEEALTSKYTDAPVLQKPVDQRTLKNLLAQKPKFYYPPLPRATGDESPLEIGA